MTAAFRPAVSPPDVGMFLLSHRALRRDFRRLAAVFARPDARPARLADPFRVAVDMLLLHHRAEDDLLWPALRERRSDLVPEVDALEQEHAALDHLVELLRAGIGLGGPAETLADIADDIATHVEQHLAREEALIVPAIVDSLTAEEWIEIDGRRKARLSPEEMATSVAWVLSAAPVTERDRYAALLPPPVRDLWRDVWAPAYASRVSALYEQ